MLWVSTRLLALLRCACCMLTQLNTSTLQMVIVLAATRVEHYTPNALFLHL
jgi:hypothetical protein